MPWNRRDRQPHERQLLRQSKITFRRYQLLPIHGGFRAISRALSGGLVLAVSIYDDLDAQLLWLDSLYPLGTTGSGTPRGMCSATSGVLADVEVQYPNASVTFSNIKLGPIGFTY